jgi:hypothetical protein
MFSEKDGHNTLKFYFIDLLDKLTFKMICDIMQDKLKAPGEL